MFGRIAGSQSVEAKGAQENQKAQDESIETKKTPAPRSSGQKQAVTHVVNGFSVQTVSFFSDFTIRAIANLNGNATVESCYPFLSPAQPVARRLKS